MRPVSLVSDVNLAVILSALLDGPSLRSLSVYYIYIYIYTRSEGLLRCAFAILLVLPNPHGSATLNPILAFWAQKRLPAWS